MSDVGRAEVDAGVPKSMEPAAGVQAGVLGKPQGRGDRRLQPRRAARAGVEIQKQRAIFQHTIVVERDRDKHEVTPRGA